MFIVILILVLALFGLSGLIMWTRSELPMIQREIALNTRKEEGSGSDYSMVKLYSVLIKVMAVLIWILGVIVLIGSGPLSNMLSYYL